MQTLLGSEPALRFLFAFIFVLVLSGGAIYLVRRFGTGALKIAVQRGRPPRLAVVDSAPIDSRRKLVIVRRDNVEHLLLIGGPTDVLIEPNIATHAVAATRETINLANEPLAPMAAAGESWDRSPNLGRSKPPIDVPSPEHPPIQPLAGLHAASEPAVSDPAVAPRPAPPVAPGDERQLADMAQRLEAALRHPLVPPTPAATQPWPAAEPRRTAAAPATPRVQRTAPPVEPPRADDKPADKPAFESLEREMASLLGRSSGSS